MKFHDFSWAFVVLVSCLLQYSAFEYSSRCPEKNERKFRAKKICSSMRRPLANYACLLDINENITNETCDIGADYATPGERYVISGGRTTRPCEPGRYQPFVLWANVSGKCLFVKSLCEEEGQLVASPGSSLSDQTCWCDFRQGYHYITKPKDLCGCVPSVEDCSCYLDLRKQLNYEENLCIEKYAAVQTQLPTEAVSPVKSGNVVNKDNYIAMRSNIPEIVTPFAIAAFIITGCLCLIIPCLIQKTPLIENRHACITVAIDLGTTSSVCAYSTTTTPKTTGIMLNKQWNTYKTQLRSYKTATCILFDKNMNTLCIGYDAQKEYKDYVIDGEGKNYYFVDRFKMELYKKSSKIKENMEIKDIQGRPVSAALVFSQMLLKLKERVMLEDLRNKYQNNEVTWVITIPAIWSDRAEDFMRTCAQRAGMCDDQLITVIESEAASVYIHYLLQEKLLNAPQPGLPKNYLVIDLGGGTDDITAHRITSRGMLKKICKPTGGNNGGKKVDDEFWFRFESIVGKPVMDALKNTEDYMEFLEEVESMNNSISYSTTEKLNCKFPLHLLDNLCKKEHNGKTFQELLDASNLRSNITISHDRLRIDRSLLEEIISKVANDIVIDIDFMLNRKSKSRTIDTFILVGGFSQSNVVRNIIEEHFRDRQIQFLYPPEEAELTVVKGAVLYGINPYYIQQDLETSYAN